MENTQTETNVNGVADAQLPAAIALAEKRLAQLNEGALAFVRARPITCVVGALALGFLVGKIAARL